MFHCLLGQYHLGSIISIESNGESRMESAVLPAEKSSSEGNLSAMMPINLRCKHSLEAKRVTIESLEVKLIWF